jgi:hypothetical protein
MQDITNIVRIGSRSKSKRLEPYNLKELIKNGKYQKSKVELRRLHEIQDELAELAGDDYRGTQGCIGKLSALLLMQNTAPLEPWKQSQQQDQHQHHQPPAPAPSGGNRKQQLQGQQQQLSPTPTSGGRGKQQQHRQQQPPPPPPLPAPTAGNKKQGKKKQGKGQAPRSGNQGKAPPAGQPPAQAVQRGRQEGPQTFDYDEWDHMGPFLKDMYRDAYEELKVPDGFNRKSFLWKRWVWGIKDRGVIENWLSKHEKDKLMASGQWQVTTSNKRVTSNGGATSSASATASGSSSIGNSRGSNGSGAADTSSSVSAAGPLGPLWRLNHKDRRQLASKWRSELRMQWASKLVDALQRTDQLQLQKRRLDEGQYEAVLKTARVIGCTTTGAAMVKDLLQTVVKPGEVQPLAGLSAPLKHVAAPRRIVSDFQAASCTGSTARCLPAASHAKFV